MPASRDSSAAGSTTMLSDLIRIDLLSRHGGVWLDATCLARADVLDAVSGWLGAGFFAFDGDLLGQDTLLAHLVSELAPVVTAPRMRSDSAERVFPHAYGHMDDADSPGIG